jgi:hypothetical protein
MTPKDVKPALSPFAGDDAISDAFVVLCEAGIVPIAVAAAIAGMSKREILDRYELADARRLCAHRGPVERAP